MRWGVILVQFPFINYGMELYINDSIPTNTNIEQMYVYASERSERALTILAFLHSQTAISFNISSVHWK